jgi:hypothetical protein
VRAIPAGSLRCLGAASEKKTKTKTDCNSRRWRPCPRCGVPMQIREPAGIGDRQQRQLFSYTRWFCCMNKQCKTTLVMPARYKVA